MNGSAPGEVTAVPGNESSGERLGSVARGSVLNLAGAAISASSGFALTVILTHALSRPAAGVFFSATALFLLATSLGQLGTSTGLVYFLSRARAQGNGYLAADFMHVALKPVIAVAFLMGAVVFGFARPIADVMGPGHAAEFVDYLRVLACFLPFAALANLSLSGTRGLGTMRPTALLDQVGRTLLQLALVGVAVVVSRHELVVWAWSAPYFGLAAAGWFAWRRRTKDRVRPSDVHRDPRLGRQFWSFTGPRAVSSVAQVAMQRLDIILVGAIAGVSEAAVYAAASRFLALGQLAGGAISQAVQPHLGTALTHEDRAEVRNLYVTSTGWLIALTWPLYLSFIVFAPSILHIFGGGYATGSDALIVLSCSMLVATGCGMVDMVLLMAGRSSWNLYNVLAAFITNLALDLWLIRPLGILGAAIGWAVAILIANLLPLAEVAFSTRVHPFGRPTIIAMVTSVVCFMGVPGAVVLLLGSGTSALLVGLPIGAICYAGCLWKFRNALNLLALTRLRRRPEGV